MQDHSLKLTFLGSGSAFTVGEDNYQSNLLIEDSKHRCLLIDCGGDVRHSLHLLGHSYRDIDAVYISHLHTDHIGGLEWLALTRYFDPGMSPPDLFIANSLDGDLWEHALKAGLSTLQSQKASLETYFNVHRVDEEGAFTWGGVNFHLLKMIHVISDHSLMPCFGLFFRVGDTQVLFTADTQYSPKHLHSQLEQADIIFHDCETHLNKSGVHANYSELLQLPEAIRQKMWLYHYNPGALPDAMAAGFLGFVERGSVFYF